MPLTPDEQRMIDAHRAKKAIEDQPGLGASVAMLVAAIEALVTIGETIFPAAPLWTRFRKVIDNWRGA